MSYQGNCARCGAMLPAGAAFCARCGADLQATWTNAPRPARRVWLAVGGALLGVLVLLALTNPGDADFGSWWGQRYMPRAVDMISALPEHPDAGIKLAQQITPHPHNFVFFSLYELGPPERSTLVLGIGQQFFVLREPPSITP